MTKRIAIAKSIEHAANLNIINNGWDMLDHHSTSIDKMTTTEINKQINLQKIHNARTKRAMNNLDHNEKLITSYGVYTHRQRLTYFMTCIHTSRRLGLQQLILEH